MFLIICSYILKYIIIIDTFTQCVQTKTYMPHTCVHRNMNYQYQQLPKQQQKPSATAHFIMKENMK